MLKEETWGTLSHLPYCILISIEISSSHTSRFQGKCFKELNFAFLVAGKKFWFTVMPGSKCVMVAQGNLFPAHWLCKMPALYLTSEIHLDVQPYYKMILCLSTANRHEVALSLTLVTQQFFHFTFVSPNGLHLFREIPTGMQARIIMKKHSSEAIVYNIQPLRKSTV